jgi:hypothetical protein
LLLRQGQRALRHWRCGLLLTVALPAGGVAAALYVWALARWAPGMRACSDCHEQYAAWLDSPRTNDVGRACPTPQVLTDVPAGVQSVAGALVRACCGLACVLARFVPLRALTCALHLGCAGLHQPVPAQQNGRGRAAAGARASGS